MNGIDDVGSAGRVAPDQVDDHIGPPILDGLSDGDRAALLGWLLLVLDERSRLIRLESRADMLVALAEFEARRRPAMSTRRVVVAVAQGLFVAAAVTIGVAGVTVLWRLAMRLIGHV